MKSATTRSGNKRPAWTLGPSDYRAAVVDFAARTDAAMRRWKIEDAAENRLDEAHKVLAPQGGWLWQVKHEAVLRLSRAASEMANHSFMKLDGTERAYWALWHDLRRYMLQGIDPVAPGRDAERRVEATGQLAMF